MIEYEIIRTNRKTMALYVSKDGKVTVRSPLKIPTQKIDEFVSSHAKWIENQLVKLAQRSEQDNHRRVLTTDEIAKLRVNSKLIFPPKVEQFAKVMNVKPTDVKITSALTRWGSCSGKNVICLPYRLMLLPEHLQDYIVVHELAHILQKNHSAKFYSVVERYLPQYKQLQKELKQLEKTLPKG